MVTVFMEKQEETKRLSEKSLSKAFEHDRDAYTEGKAAGSYLGIKAPVFAKTANQSLHNGSEKS